MLFPAAVLIGTLTLTQWQALTEQTVWDKLADCETGEWINKGEAFVQGSANWESDLGLFEGGLQFHPETWDSYKDPNHPDSAYTATRKQQIFVAERVLDDQGWEAWPTCSRLLGLRQ